jgi:predicted nucleotidyltransferase
MNTLILKIVTAQQVAFFFSNESYLYHYSLTETSGWGERKRPDDIFQSATLQTEHEQWRSVTLNKHHKSAFRSVMSRETREAYRTQGAVCNMLYYYAFSSFCKHRCFDLCCMRTIKIAIMVSDNS